MAFNRSHGPIVLGIDPGTAITGYGLVQRIGNTMNALDYGCVRPPAGSLSQKYLIIYNAICELIDTFGPDAISIETQFVRKNPQTAIKLGMARGMAVLAAAQRGIPLFEYAPTKAKLAVVGTGKASKEQVQSMVQRLLNLATPPEPEDAADALALAMCHLNAADRPVPLGVQL